MRASLPRLVFIEPQQPPTQQAVLDSITRKMCAAFRQSKQSDYAFGGVHFCRCRANSSCCDHLLPDGAVTNSLCIHYVAHHRAEVPVEQLQRIEGFDWGEAEPREKELLGPVTVSANTRGMAERSLGEPALGAWRAWGLDFDALCQGLLSYEPRARQGAEDLFHFLLNMKSRTGALGDALTRLGEDGPMWGMRALRVPDWDREAWLAPMIEMLKVAKAGEREHHIIAFCFYYLRTPVAQVPSELVGLRDTAEGELQKAARFAIRQLTGE